MRVPCWSGGRSAGRDSASRQSRAVRALLVSWLAGWPLIRRGNATTSQRLEPTQFEAAVRTGLAGCYTFYTSARVSFGNAAASTEIHGGMAAWPVAGSGGFRPRATPSAPMAGRRVGHAAHAVVLRFRLTSARPIAMPGD